jgi:hypothetical protein
MSELKEITTEIKIRYKRNKSKQRGYTTKTTLG